MTTVNRKERDKQLRKADILKAAEHVFASKGYYGATIQNIAKEAQYGTGTVYLYFKDKYTLYFSLLEEKISSLVDVAKEKTEDVEDARKKLEIFIQESLIFFEKNQSFFRIYILEKSSLQLIVSKKSTVSSRAMEHASKYLEKLIMIAQEQGVIKKEYDPVELADVFTAIMGSIILSWGRGGSEKEASLSGRARFIFDMFLSGAGKK